jgi:phosphatidylserine decarboxylase
MLDSLGSTLSRATVDSFFTRHNKKPRDDELTYAEAIQCLEAELGRPECEKKRIESDDSNPNTNALATPSVITESESEFMKLSLGELDFSGPQLGFEDDENSPAVSAVINSPEGEAILLPPYQSGEVSGEGLIGTGGSSGGVVISSANPTIRDVSSSSSDADADVEANQLPISNSGSPDGCDSFERVINVKNCPLCHRPRFNAKAEVDIVTHLAVCASQDWAKVDQIVVGTFVTASQAQRKWYTKIISKVSSGNYKLGAVSFVFFLRFFVKCGAVSEISHLRTLQTSSCRIE